MDEHADFLQRHRARLLQHLDGEAPAGEPEPLAYVDRVLEEWCARFADAALPEPTAEERTFWFALYQLEELAELPAAGEPLPYEDMLRENLAHARECLREGGPLPAGFMATRPNGD